MFSIAPPWRLWAVGLLGFVTGVLMMEAWADRKPAHQKIVFHPGEVLVSLLSKELFWPKAEVSLGQALWIIRLAQTSNLQGACRVHKQSARLRFHTDLATIGFQPADYLLVAELIKNKNIRSLNKLAVVDAKTAAQLAACTMRESVIFHE